MLKSARRVCLIDGLQIWLLQKISIESEFEARGMVSCCLPEGQYAKGEMTGLLAMLA